jgi:hypothetical protein
MTEAPESSAPRTFAWLPSRAVTALVAGLAVVLMTTVVVLAPRQRHRLRRYARQAADC